MPKTPILLRRAASVHVDVPRAPRAADGSAAHTSACRVLRRASDADLTGDRSRTIGACIGIAVVLLTALTELPLRWIVMLVEVLR